MSFVTDNSLVNNIMFAPPKSSYTSDLGVFWIKDTCCLFIKYEDERAFTLTLDDNLETHPVIILCHGNACDIGHMVNFARLLALECQSHVVLYEYPGYGLSSGKPSEKSCMNGLTNIIKHLTKKMAIPIQNLVFYGQSIGSGIAGFGYKYCRTTFGKSPAGLVLISPYLSIKTLAEDITSSSYVPILERFNTQENIKYCDTGLLIVHGDQDEVIPVDHGKKLHKIAQCPVKILDIVEDVGHNGLPYDRIVDGCKSVLKQVSSHILYENVKYQNDICWDVKCNHQKEESSSIGTSIATSLEATSAVSTDASESCVLL